jgi:ABC-type transport system substrate-binding protein
MRQAIAHAIDRQTMAEALTDGRGAAADPMVLPQAELFTEAERIVAKHPYDLQRTDQLMADLGFRKDGSGLYTSPSEGRFTLEIAVTDANPTEGTIMVDGLRRSGIDATLRVIPRAQTTEPLIFSNFPGILNGQVTDVFAVPVDHFRASQIARAETRYLGTNFSGFDHPEYERLASAFDGALARSERNRLGLEMLKLLGDELPAHSLYYNAYILAYAAGLRGPMSTVSRNVAAWNLHEWEWTS